METTVKSVPEYISCKETAKLVREALKRAYPGFKFSVRSHIYSMGAAIYVGWVNGPRAQDVDKIVKEFDASHYGTDYVFTRSAVTDFKAKHAEALQLIQQRCAVEGEGNSERFADQWTNDIASSIVHARDYLTENDFEKAFRRVVMREEI